MNVLEFEKPLLEIKLKLKELESQERLSSEDLEFKQKLERQASAMEKELYSHLDSWMKTKIARHPQRPSLPYLINNYMSDFIELKGERTFRDDPSIIGGFVTIKGVKFMIIGHCKGSNTKENMERNFGMAHPEGYRKGIRLMKLAERFRLPVLTIINTPGAYPGIEAEQRNQSEAIAQSIMQMSALKVPCISVITGEGGSGGAIALAMGNAIMMLENAYYSVISPEGCASILWGDASKASVAANALCYSADHLQKFGIIDEIIQEGGTAAHNNQDLTCRNIVQKVIEHYDKLKKMSPEELVENRYKKFRNIGVFIEKSK